MHLKTHCSCNKAKKLVSIDVYCLAIWSEEISGNLPNQKVVLVRNMCEDQFEVLSFFIMSLKRADLSA